jgi:hypothetical protein
MGHVTVSLEEEDEQKLRSIADMKYKNKKGSLAKVISESIELFSRNSSRERAMNRQFKWMEQGFNLGKITAKSREDIYDRL